MTTKYRAGKRSDGSIVALIYLTPNPNIPAQIIASIIRIDYDRAKGELDANAHKTMLFQYGATDKEMVEALLKSTGYTDDDLVHHIGYAKQPA